ncbi:ricin-type beta-trefoil lectin domain protein [Kitasatospora sp. NBC_00315]|uniref:ricin-type beta-trefoil lectin domain protein n=1 Tax=Kitasatospora sp. NBC_00315 TaxID=2975963 RepID=UPI00352DE4F3
MKKSVAVAVLALVTAVGGAWTSASQAAGATAGPATVRATAASAASAAAVRLLPVGASFTYGSHSSTGNGYRGPLWDELTGEGHQLDFVGSVREGTMADPDNEGHPGYRIDAVAGLANASLTRYRPNVVTLIVGTSDLIQNHDVSNAPARLSALVDQILTADPGVSVMVANLPGATLPSLVSLTPAYNAAIPDMVQSKQAQGKHVEFVDMSAVTAADIGPDGIHPGDVGYQKMATAWNKGIQAADAAGWITPAASLGAATPGASGEVLAGAAGKCLDVNGSSSTDGTAVQLWGCNHGSAQTWTAYSDGSLRALGKCLNAAGGGTADGTKAQLATCNGTGAQVWQAYQGSYRNLVSGKCLDDPNGSTTDGTPAQLWTCNATAAQQWGHPGVGPVNAGAAGKCLDVSGGTNVNGTKAQLWDCNGSVAQQWVTRDGVVQGVGMCLDVTGAGTANGTPVEVWDCTGGANQVWQVGPDNSLVNPASGRCLDVPNSSASNGIQLEIWDCHAGTNQRWTVPGA